MSNQKILGTLGKGNLTNAQPTIVFDINGLLKEVWGKKTQSYKAYNRLFLTAEEMKKIIEEESDNLDPNDKARLEIGISLLPSSKPSTSPALT